METHELVDHNQQPDACEIHSIVTSLDFEVAFVGVRVDSARIVNVPVDDGDVSKSLCRNIIQPSADLKPEGGVTGGRVVKYVGSVDLDNFHYLERNRRDQRKGPKGMYADGDNTRFVGSL